MRNELQRAEIRVKVDTPGSAGQAPGDVGSREPPAAALRTAAFEPALARNWAVDGVACVVFQRRSPSSPRHFRPYPVMNLRAMVAANCALALGLVAAPLAPGQAEVAAPAKHQLFLGVDLDLQDARGVSRVRSVDRRNFIVGDGSRPKKIPMRDASASVRLSRTLKLSETLVTVSDLKAERAYSAGNEPMQRFAAIASQAAAQEQLVGYGAVLERQGQVADLSGKLDAMYGPNGRGMNPTDFHSLVELTMSGSLLQNTSVYGRESDGDVLRRNPGAYNVGPSTGSDANSPGRNEGKYLQALAAGQYDAIEVSFNLRAPRRLSDPYVVVTAEIAAPGDKPNESRTWVSAVEIKAVDQDLLHVRLKEGGFPIGYVLKSCQIHLYNRSEEVATTVAPKRVELTLDEAFEYVLLDHLARNKGRSVAASRGLGAIPAPTRTALQRREVYVRVTADGVGHGVFADAGCREPIESEPLVAALRTMRFKPALEKGRPVDGVARLAL